MSILEEQQCKYTLQEQLHNATPLEHPLRPTPKLKPIPKGLSCNNIPRGLLPKSYLRSNPIHQEQPVKLILQEQLPKLSHKPILQAPLVHQRTLQELLSLVLELKLFLQVHLTKAKVKLPKFILQEQLLRVLSMRTQVGNSLKVN